jgi:SAM-dependent methyltransferase
MTVFADYSTYYDIFNVSKEYAAEVDFVLQQSGLDGLPDPSLLDLGCGTCLHAGTFASRGWQVLGVDMSPTMLEMAAVRQQAMASPERERLELSLGDVRSFRAGRQFDMVTSLFHVASYQTANGDLDRFLQTAISHLKPGGVLIFDYWYGPAVLNLRPATRVRRYEDEAIKATRIGEPTIFTEQNAVNVHFDVTFIDKTTATARELSEDHLMRYFFLPEINAALERSGFSSWRSQEWMGTSSPSDKSWSVFTVAQA